MKIAILYRFASDPTGKRSRLYIPKEFTDIFDELGVMLIPVVSNNNLEEYLKICDGLIIPGSYADVNPDYYHEEKLSSKIYDVDEYKFDRQVIKMFNNANKPILGVCAGIQELNVFFEGTLNQYIDNHSDTIHNINIDKNSFIYEVFNNEKVMVNSLHHQCIKDLAPGFRATAISDDNIIEAIEKDNVVGVQWHPEIMKDINFFKKYLAKYYK